MEFQKFSEASRIQRHLTAPYTPQQNEVVERRNRTLLEMTRSILKHIEFAFTHKNQRKRCSLEVLDKKLAIAHVALFEDRSSLCHGDAELNVGFIWIGRPIMHRDLYVSKIVDLVPTDPARGWCLLHFF